MSTLNKEAWDWRKPFRHREPPGQKSQGGKEQGTFWEPGHWHNHWVRELSVKREELATAE